MKVSIITPTANRHFFLEEAYQYVKAQTYEDWEWLIADDTSEPSTYFMNLSDSRVTYMHTNKRASVGEKRNRLIEACTGEVIIHFDDDDYYSPTYVADMLNALLVTGADLVNLTGWYLHDLRKDIFAYWDLTIKSGPHVLLELGDVRIFNLDHTNNHGLLDSHLGYGFAYAYKRSVYQKVKFERIDFDEDGRFVKSLIRNGYSIHGFADQKGMVLHRIHNQSSSRCFPQYILPPFLKSALFNGL